MQWSILQENDAVMSRGTAKATKLHERPAKTQISLHILQSDPSLLDALGGQGLFISSYG